MDISGRVHYNGKFKRTNACQVKERDRKSIERERVRERERVSEREMLPAAAVK